MLRLNSQYAKSYLRQSEKSASYFKETANLTRGKGQSQVEYQRSSYGNRRDSSMYMKNKDYQQKEYTGCNNNEEYEQNRYARQQITNPLTSYNKSPRLTREQGFDLKQNFKANEVSEPQSYSNKSKNIKYDKYQKQDKYERYENKSNHFQNNLGANRADFVAKHNRRNEEIKNKIGRDVSYNTRNYMDYRQPIKNTEFQSKFPKKDSDSQSYMNRQVRNREKQEQYYEQRPQKYAKKLQFQDQYDQQTQTRAKNNMSQFKQRYECRIQDNENPQEIKLDCFENKSIELNQRKNKLYKEIQQTPNRNHSSTFQPGSAQKKRSLIEKSQMLQQKLKKLTSTPNHFHANIEKNSQFKAQQNRTRSTTNQRNYQIDQSSSRNTSRYSNLNFNQQSGKQAPRNHQSQQPYQRHSDILRTPSPILQSRGSGKQGQAIERIMDLNSKINERIQSIISNYAKK